MYNFLQETVNARDDTAFHLQFFESQDLNLTLRLLRVTVDSIRKARSVLCLCMYVCASFRACVLKGHTVNRISVDTSCDVRVKMCGRKT